MSGIDWEFDGVEIVTCNCDYGCPCQFNARPTQGNCHATGAFEIEKGRFGATPLDGLRFVALFAFPAAIHEGHGQALLIVDERADDAQRAAIHAIFRGEETEPGATIFNVFANVIETYHEPMRGRIELTADMEKRKGRFSVDGLVAATVTPIRNPVTGEPHRARLTLPHGFEYHEAEFASSEVRTDSGPIALAWSGRHAHFARLHWTRHGPAHA
jgi:hypothetical protein